VGGILTGVVVAFGATFLLSAIIGGILAALGVTDPNVTRNETVDAGIAGGVAFAIAVLLAYLWGGYMAGRMARGAGVLSGVLVRSWPSFLQCSLVQLERRSVLP
jgi:hypothetical protein